MNTRTIPSITLSTRDDERKEQLKALGAKAVATLNALDMSHFSSNANALKGRVFWAILDDADDKASRAYAKALKDYNDACADRDSLASEDGKVKAYSDAMSAELKKPAEERDTALIESVRVRLRTLARTQDDRNERIAELDNIVTEKHAALMKALRTCTILEHVKEDNELLFDALNELPDMHEFNENAFDSIVSYVTGGRGIALASLFIGKASAYAEELSKAGRDADGIRVKNADTKTAYDALKACAEDYASMIATFEDSYFKRVAVHFNGAECEAIAERVGTWNVQLDASGRANAVIADERDLSAVIKGITIVKLQGNKITDERTSSELKRTFEQAKCKGKRK